MLGTLTVLLVFQLAGEALVLYFGIPVPGPVVGMPSCFCRTGGERQRSRRAARAGANGILKHLSLLFVPAGTGILVHFSRVADEWPAILLALAGSTALAIGVTALTMQALIRRRSRRTGAR